MKITRKDIWHTFVVFALSVSIYTQPNVWVKVMFAFMLGILLTLIFINQLTKELEKF